ncbi:MAG: hypothetical protein ABIJ10_01885 [Candidatus Micrarchaeota archaeon]|nr:hypothetical protein [Candidatus Micrarchaeota archaeon]MBU1887349.1 hypothetical protein [Candidatus Micrarchaeota archaeon]
MNLRIIAVSICFILLIGCVASQTKAEQTENESLDIIDTNDSNTSSYSESFQIQTNISEIMIDNITYAKGGVLYDGLFTFSSCANKTKINNSVAGLVFGNYSLYMIGIYYPQHERVDNTTAAVFYDSQTDSYFDVYGNTMAYLGGYCILVHEATENYYPCYECINVTIWECGMA